MTRTIFAARSVAIAALVGLFFLANTSSGQAKEDTDDHADEHLIRIINDTGSTMREFYAANVGNSAWLEDIFGQEVLPSGDSVMINFDNGNDNCLYWFKAVFADRDDIYDNRVNVCKISSYRFHD